MSGGWFLTIFGVFGWVMAGPILHARGWNPAVSFEENVFQARTFASFFGSLGLALLLSGPASTLLPRHIFISELAGFAAAIVGAGTLTWTITLLRRRRSPNMSVAFATAAVWLPVLALVLLVDENKTHGAAGAILSGLLLNVGSWVTLMARGQSRHPDPLA